MHYIFFSFQSTTHCFKLYTFEMNPRNLVHCWANNTNQNVKLIRTQLFLIWIWSLHVKIHFWIECISPSLCLSISLSLFRPIGDGSCGGDWRLVSWHFIYGVFVCLLVLFPFVYFIFHSIALRVFRSFSAICMFWMSIWFKLFTLNNFVLQPRHNVYVLQSDGTT